MIDRFKEKFPRVTITLAIELWIKNNPRIVWMMCQWGASHSLVDLGLQWLSAEDKLPDALVNYFWVAATIEEGGRGELPPKNEIIQMVGLPTAIRLGLNGSTLGHGAADLTNPNGDAGNNKGWARGSLYINTDTGQLYVNRGDEQNVNWVLVGAQSP